MPFYDNYLKMVKQPKDQWIDQIRNLVLEEFENSSSYMDDVEVEEFFGTLTFVPIIARVTSLVNSTTGERVNDDFKKIIFRDVDYKPDLGTRFSFSDNIWITYSTSNINSPTSSCYIRRCNSTINKQDKYGVIHNEPVIVDYNVTETQLYKNEKLDTASGRIYITCQNNEHTSPYDINMRFMVGSNSYKTRERSKFNKSNTFDKESKLVKMYADFDNKDASDNEEFEVANYVDPQYKISIIDNISGEIGHIGTIVYKVFNNTQEVDEAVVWTTNDEAVVTIDWLTGEFEFISEGACIITCSLFNNQLITADVNVVVSTVVEIIKETKILPNVTYLELNRKQTYNVFEYENGIVADTIFVIEAISLPHNYYEFTKTDNSFTVRNKKTSDYPLIVQCKNNKTDEITSISIELGGLF